MWFQILSTVINYWVEVNQVTYSILLNLDFFVNFCCLLLQTYKSIERKKSWDKCKFSDRIPDDRKYSHQAYVYLELAGHHNTIMQFDKKGRIMPRKRLENCLRNKRAGRHGKRCTPIKNVLLYYNMMEENCCNEAFIDLCKGPIRNMAELRDKCEEVRESGCNARHHFGWSSRTLWDQQHYLQRSH